MRPSAAFIHLTTVDPSIGRIDKSILSQQTLMELLIDGCLNKHKLFESFEDSMDISEWKGVVVNDTNEVLLISWIFLGLGGSIALQWVPPTVRKLKILDTKLSTDLMVGTIDLTVLPESLNEMRLSGNHFEGGIDLTKLPKNMVELRLSSNRLSGLLDLTALPSTMEKLHLEGNSFEGLTDFSKLPPPLKVLNISDNKNLEGVIRFNPKKLICQADKTKVQKIIVK